MPPVLTPRLQVPRMTPTAGRPPRPDQSELGTISVENDLMPPLLTPRTQVPQMTPAVRPRRPPLLELSELTISNSDTSSVVNDLIDLSESNLERVLSQPASIQGSFLNGNNEAARGVQFSASPVLLQPGPVQLPLPSGNIAVVRPPPGFTSNSVNAALQQPSQQLSPASNVGATSSSQTPGIVHRVASGVGVIGSTQPQVSSVLQQPSHVSLPPLAADVGVTGPVQPLVVNPVIQQPPLIQGDSTTPSSSTSTPATSHPLPSAHVPVVLD